MADNIPRDRHTNHRPGTQPPGTHPPDTQLPGTQLPKTDGIPIDLVTGNASADELSALIAVVVVLASASGDENSGQSDHPSTGSGTAARSDWGSPGRLVRTTYPHGPGGWRASAAPR